MEVLNLFTRDENFEMNDLWVEALKCINLAQRQPIQMLACRRDTHNGCCGAESMHARLYDPSDVCLRDFTVSKPVALTEHSQTLTH